MRTLFSMTAGILILAGSPSQAATYYAGCNDCANSVNKSTAIQTAPNANGAYYVYVVDSTHRTLKRWRVFVNYEPEFGTMMKGAVAVTPQAAVLTEFNQVMAWLDAFAGLPRVKSSANPLFDFDSWFVVPSDSGVHSAFDLINNGQAQAAVSDYLNDLLPSIPYGSFIAQVVFGEENVKLRIRFADGSDAIFFAQTAANDTKPEWLYKKGTARDPENNFIPDTPQAFIGFVGSFSRQSNFDNFSQLANQFGIGMSPSGAVVIGAGVNATISCSVAVCTITIRHQN